MIAQLKSKIYKYFNIVDVQKCSYKNIVANPSKYNSKLLLKYRPYYVELETLYIDKEFWNSLIMECQKEILDISLKHKITFVMMNLEPPIKEYFQTELDKYISKRIAYSYSDSYDFDLWCYDLKNYLPQYSIYYLDIKSIKILLDGYQNINKAINDNDVLNEIEVLEIELPKLYNFLTDLKYKKIFCKLGSMSSKRDRKLRALTSIRDILYFLITSKEFATEYLYRIKTNKQLSLIFMEWNDDIESSLEYRVFVYNKKVTTISQQKFKIFKKLTNKIVRDHSNTIIEYINDYISPNMKYNSAVIDVWINNKGDCKLIEINPWGEYSGTSSSLFHWENDLNQLYGRNSIVTTKYIV